MHVGQFITQYPFPDQFEAPRDYYCSGSERVAQSLATNLGEQDIDVSVYTANRNCTYSTDTRCGVDIHRSPSLWTVGTAEVPLTYCFDYLSEDLDVVHAHESTPPGMVAAYVYSKLNGTPLVVTHHGGENYELSGGALRRSVLWTYVNTVAERIYEHADSVVVPSEGFTEASEVLSPEQHAIRNIPVGIDVETFDIDRDSDAAKQQIGADQSDFLILFFGSHTERKGVDILLDAFTRLSNSQKAQGLGLCLAGSGEKTNQLHEHARNWDLDNILFPGFVPESEKPVFFRAADCCVVPSLIKGSEMFPLVILEAAASGTPIVASDLPSIRTILNGESCSILFDSGDAEQLADSIARLYGDGDLHDKYAENARQMAERYTWSNVSEQYIQLYEAIQK